MPAPLGVAAVPTAPAHPSRPTITRQSGRDTLASYTVLECCATSAAIAASSAVTPHSRHCPP